MESLNLDTPQVTSVTGYSVRTVVMSLDGPMIRVTVMDNQGRKTAHEYVDDEALALIVALNKADLSTVSLQKRILQRLVADGRLPSGTIVGSPD